MSSEQTITSIRATGEAVKSLLGAPGQLLEGAPVALMGIPVMEAGAAKHTVEVMAGDTVVARFIQDPHGGNWYEVGPGHVTPIRRGEAS